MISALGSTCRLSCQGSSLDWGHSVVFKIMQDTFKLHVPSLCLTPATCINGYQGIHVMLEDNHALDWYPSQEEQTTYHFMLLKTQISP